MAEVNKEYYKAYKKAVLDYILKDRDEMTRVGISIVFKPVKDWGQATIIASKILNTNINMDDAKKFLLINHILYP